jgi:DNA-binding NarL/FixJ family response regulator
VAPTSPTDRLLGHVERLASLPSTLARLRACSDVGDLFARAAEIACAECQFTRGVVLSVGAGELSATQTDVLADPASDTLRRRALEQPVPITPGSDEAKLIRPTDGSRRIRSDPTSLLDQTLGLEHRALAVVAPEHEALAVLVLDRSGPPVDELDRALVTAFGSMLEMALEHAVLRARLADVTAELRHLTVSAQALMVEALEAPTTLPTAHGGRPSFPLTEGAAPAIGRERIHELLTEREARIAALLAEGQSNREIASRLILSPETVKAHVARILRKLGAANRVEAAARYVRLTHASS